MGEVIFVLVFLAYVLFVAVPMTDWLSGTLKAVLGKDMGSSVALFVMCTVTALMFWGMLWGWGWWHHRRRR